MMLNAKFAKNKPTAKTTNPAKIRPNIIVIPVTSVVKAGIFKISIAEIAANSIMPIKAMKPTISDGVRDVGEGTYPSGVSVVLLAGVGKPKTEKILLKPILVRMFVTSSDTNFPKK